jgi:hypothetical protein
VTEEDVAAIHVSIKLLGTEKQTVLFDNPHTGLREIWRHNRLTREYDPSDSQFVGISPFGTYATPGPVK